MEKQFKEIKQFTTAMGFKNQKQFREHVESKRLERSKYKNHQSNIDYIYSLNPKARSVEKDSEYSEVLKIFANTICMQKSSHSSLIHSHKIEIDIVRYRGGKYSLSYYNVSYYRYGNNLILETYFRNIHTKKVIELPVNWKRFTDSHEGLLPSEIGYESIGGILVRFSLYQSLNYRFHKTGISVQLDDPFNHGKKYWEHGETIRDCIQGRESKIKAVTERNRIKAENERFGRKQRLVSRLCNKIRVTFQDALDSGNCIQGVSSFVRSNFPEKMPMIENNNFVNNKSISLGELKSVESSNYTERVINYVSMMVSQLTI